MKDYNNQLLALQQAQFQLNTTSLSLTQGWKINLYLLLLFAFLTLKSIEIFRQQLVPTDGQGNCHFRAQ
jgi:hypothetical protein